MAFPTSVTPESVVDGNFIAGVHETFANDMLAMLDGVKAWDYAISGEHRITSGSSILVPIPGSLTYGTTALPDKADPTLLDLTDSETEITTAQHGDAVVVMEQLYLQKDLNTVAAIGKAMLHAANNKLEDISGAVALAGSNVQLVGGAASADDLTADDQITLEDIGRGVAKLRNRKILPWENGYYRLFLNSVVIQDLLEETGLTGVTGVLSPTDSTPFEKGWVTRIAGCDVFRADALTIESLAAGDDGGGDNDADLVKSLIVGKDYMHRATQLPFQARFNAPLGDIMQRAYSYMWKKYFGVKRMREAAAQRILSRSPSCDNP